MMRVGVLISGRGSNLQALIDSQAELGAYEIALVISNIPDAPGLERARRAGIETLTISHKPFGKDRAAFEREIDSALRERGIELLALAGFMRIFTPPFVQAWNNRMVNIHPALSPAFPGRDTHARALAAGVKLHGCTVHFVTETLDEGPIVGQAALPVLPEDTEESLAARVLALEHVLYPQCLARIALGGEFTLQTGNALFHAFRDWGLGIRD
jgi:formyltetrahydrofolate-dependent phosphoribosylglycinamide formyltransferase